MLPAIVFICCNVDAWVREGRFVYNPNEKRVMTPDPRYIQGISGVSQVTANSYGLRGKEPGNEQYRILIIGNSLTECLYLDDQETWPHLIEKELLESGIDVKVFNAGRSGDISAQRIMKIYNEYESLNFDLVIIYPMGELASNYSPLEGFNYIVEPDWKQSRLSFIHNISRMRIHQLKKRLKKYFNGLVVTKKADTNIESATGEQLIERRAKKRNAPQISWQDDLENKSEDSFRKGVSAVLEFFKRKKQRTLVLSELNSILFSKAPHYLDLRWGELVELNGQSYKYSIDDELKRLKNKNAILFSEAKLHNVSHLKVGSFSTLDANCFYDQHHFNEVGAVRFSKVVTSKIKQMKLFEKRHAVLLGKANNSY